MADANVRLTGPDLLRAIAALNSLVPYQTELIARSTGRTRPSPVDVAGADPELTEFLLVEEGSSTSYQCPTAVLRAGRAALLTAVAARALLPSGVVTAAVLGSGPLAEAQLMSLARFVPDISHVAICPTAADPTRQLDEAVLDELAAAGFALSVKDTVEEAVFGANLVVATAESPGRLSFPWLTAGALVVDVSGARMLDELVERVSEVYVDAPDLLPGRGARGNRYRSVPVVGLGEVLAGDHRLDADRTRLVELLSAGSPDISSTTALVRTAHVLGLGSPSASWAPASAPPPFT